VLHYCMNLRRYPLSRNTRYDRLLPLKLSAPWEVWHLSGEVDILGGDGGAARHDLLELAVGGDSVVLRMGEEGMDIARLCVRRFGMLAELFM
jgi:hypothetical protein